MRGINKQPVGFFASVDYGFNGAGKMFVRKFDQLGICFYRRYFDDYQVGLKKYYNLCKRLSKS